LMGKCNTMPNNIGNPDQIRSPGVIVCRTKSGMISTGLWHLRNWHKKTPTSVEVFK